MKMGRFEEKEIFQTTVKKLENVCVQQMHGVHVYIHN